MRKGIVLYGVPEFLSRRLNWVPPYPAPECIAPPPIWVLGGDTLARGEGGGDPIQATGHKLWYSLYSSYPFTLY
jgi:hypothetical protein